MNDNQILEVHSRWVYNFMGIISEAQASFSFSHLCILFKNYSQILVILKPYTERRNWHDTALDANECVWWIDSFIANLGHPLCGCPVNAGFSISNEERQNSSFQVLNPALTGQPHKGWPRFAMNESIHQTHSFASNAVSCQFLLSVLGFKITKIWE